MINKFFLPVLLLIFFAAGTHAQEILFPLSSNPVIKEYLEKNPVTSVSNLRITSSSLSLPFEDDFSGQGIYPNTQLWMDSDAFINQTFCDNPVTIGVATFDGINKLGNPHDSNSTSTQPIICDYLTSQRIDLSLVPVSDSVYFSFYFQPQGLGDEPEDGDSLVLQFYNEDSTWVNMWVADGKPDSAFQEVRLGLLDTLFFWSGFQFRFYNYATPNGNRDHWNIDYVSLKDNSSYSESLKEISLVYPIQSYLQDYSAMPYAHYKSEIGLGNNPVKNTVTDTIRTYEFTGGGTAASSKSLITDELGTTIFNQSFSPPITTVIAHTDTLQSVTVPAGVFPTTVSEYADFYIQHQLSTTASGITKNDTSYFTQHFQNYYAYDDGTAESATGVPVAYSKYAYQFDVKKQDTLRGVQIYFNPWGKNVHLDLFSLCLWSSINVIGNTETLVHQRIDNKPANIDSISGFATYFFDAPLIVGPGTIYVGLIQSSATPIGIGVDRNIDSHNKMFVNYNNQWYNSTINGSWMMRPFFGKDLTIDVSNISASDSHFEVYPNPAKNQLTIRGKQFAIETAAIKIHNVIGKMILAVQPKAGSKQEIIDVSSLSDGVYFVHISDKENSFSEVQKVIIQH